MSNYLYDCLILLFFLNPKHYEGRNLSSSPLYPNCLGLYLEHSRCSVNIHWMNECKVCIRQFQEKWWIWSVKKGQMPLSFFFFFWSSCRFQFETHTLDTHFWFLSIIIWFYYNAHFTYSFWNYFFFFLLFHGLIWPSIFIAAWYSISICHIFFTNS